ncbi:5-hydroxytryptamine receptor 2C-like [Exaiptasia diaphana]|uniref:G-protein coupled receptors family 1 profile domain-containing protein n=1 Tax=Exaiptasia diaphana TaxID=2652724 RepID=A0A913YFE7_EXADI|nr:5-hydroxytryptamine receptor 2C-like [Exaiptasia diaphana]
MWPNAWLFILEAVAITAANTATIVIFARKRRLHNKQYIMIISQAVADLFVGLVSVPMFIVSRRAKDLPYPSLVRKLYFITDGFFAAASLFGLAALATERAHATYFPFRHSTLGKGPYIIGIVLMWAAPVIVAIGLSVNFMDNQRAIVRMVLICSTLVIISVAYSLIVYKVRCQTTHDQAHDVTIQENKKLTVTLAVVTALSLAMWLPFQFATV